MNKDRKNRAVEDVDRILTQAANLNEGASRLDKGIHKQDDELTVPESVAEEQSQLKKRKTLSNPEDEQEGKRLAAPEVSRPSSPGRGHKEIWPGPKLQCWST